MDGYRKNNHAIHYIKYLLIWVTKYRYKILSGPIAIRAHLMIVGFSIPTQLIWGPLNIKLILSLNS